MIRPGRQVPTRPLDRKGVARALEVLGALVRAKGLKHSQVRDAVAKAALQTDGHFTADELLGTLHERKVPGAHAATVYRVLPLLVEAGLLQQSLHSGSARQRYERAFERSHHDHLVCTRCGTVVEFEHLTIETLQRELSERLGFKLTGHVHELFGVCGRCQRTA